MIFKNGRFFKALYLSNKAKLEYGKCLIVLEVYYAINFYYSLDYSSSLDDLVHQSIAAVFNSGITIEH